MMLGIMDTLERRLSTLTDAQVTHVNSLDFVRWQVAFGRMGRRLVPAAEYFKDCWPRSFNIDLVTKAAVAAGTTTDATWGGPLSTARPLQEAFLSLLRPKTLLGRIQNLRQVPFNVSVMNQTAGGTYAWSGEGAPAPVTKTDLATVTLPYAKASGIIVLTEELAKISSPSAEVLVREEMLTGMAQFLNTQFTDPAVAAVANVSPASITNGAGTSASAGTSQANAATDIQTLLSAFVAANPSTDNLVLLMRPSNAVALARATGSQTLGLGGGTLWGIPVYTSGVVGTNLIAFDASRILVADEGGVEIDMSESALVQLDSAPSDPTVAGSVLVSFFGRNLVGFKATRWIHWKRAESTAVRYISGAAYV